MGNKGIGFSFVFLFLILSVGLLPASADLKGGMRLLDKMQSKTHALEQELAKIKVRARKEHLPLVQNLDKIRKQIRSLEERLNLTLDRREPEKIGKEEGPFKGNWIF